MENSRKRKRDANPAADSSDQQPAKIRAQDETVPAKGGQRRQVRSERKKKRAVEAKANAAKKRKTNNVELMKTTPKDAAQDDLATSQDFVPLAVDVSQSKPKEKRRSPRSIRKEQRQKKAEMQASVEISSDRPGTKTSQLEAPGSEARFICFVGNLPYTATTQQISLHFSKLQPKAIRMSTDKQTGKSKGFAFLEFDNYDKMKTCLKLYHHSIFDPEPEAQENASRQGFRKDQKSAGRKINVELTAGGGGGKSAGRKDKIRQKNQKLDEERARDWEKKRKDEIEKERKGKGGQRVSGANAEDTAKVGDDRGDIHPSRLGRVRG